MPIRLVCPGCGKGINAPDHYAGRTAKCPGCGAGLTVPLPAQQAAPSVATSPPPPPPLGQAVTPPPAPSESSAGRRERRPSKAGIGWGFLLGCVTATAVIGAMVIGTVIWVKRQAGDGVRQVEEAVVATQPRVASRPEDPPPTTSDDQPPPAPQDPQVAAAQQALAELRETLGAEIPGFEGMLESELAGLQPGAADEEVDPQALEEGKLVEVVSIRLTPADLADFKLTNTLELEIRNGGDKVLEAFRMKCQLKSPDRPIPWGEEVVVYKLPGGLLPGETRKLSLAMKGGLAACEIPKDAEVTAVVTRVSWFEEER